MTDRPTTVQVDFELDFATQPIATGTQAEWHLCAHRLAREVRALRVELSRAQWDHWCLQRRCGHLEETNARVEALPAKWRQMQPLFRKNPVVYAKRCVFEQLTEALESALRGPQ